VAPTLPPSSQELAEFRALARDVIVLLCRTFGRTLQRVTLWKRIESALRTASLKVDDEDTDRWLNLLFDHICAQPELVARLPLAEQVRQQLAAYPPQRRRDFIRWVRSHLYPILIDGHRAWEEAKQADRADPTDPTDPTDLTDLEEP
jgi:hypothetical protein